MKNVLYLASQSKSRQILLEMADIPYKLISHRSSEEIEYNGGSFENYVLSISEDKMKHVKLPSPHEVEGKPFFVLTGDTLVRAANGEILGKPKDKADAKRMLRLLREGPAMVATACCIEKKVYESNGEIKTLDSRHLVSTAIIEYCVDEYLLDTYLEKVPLSLSVASAGTIEGYGHNFVKTINGSYTAALGLPVFELRGALKEMNFL